jgi:glucosamine--fructose-6-phosphate aminotransferase (isomerizing)
MCGIAGYVGPLQAESILLVALERLRYRGYDSAGIAITDGTDIAIGKTAGRIEVLDEALKQRRLAGTCGIAHTRWATHGEPSSKNAHPHQDTDGSVAVVHNGIIENHDELRQELQKTGVHFLSETDTEVIPHLLAAAYRTSEDPLEALRSVLPRLTGSYGFSAIFAEHPETILVARQGSPILLGRGADTQGRKQHLVASDIPALLPHAQEVFALEDGHYALLSADNCTVFDTHHQEIDPAFETIEVDATQVSRGDYDSFMAKEIAEQPAMLQRLLDSRLNGDDLLPPDLGVDLAKINHMVFLSCGTSWHAALLGKRFLEHYARIHVEVDISSEYRYRNPVASGDTLVVAISQSGETADTLAGVHLAKSKFLPVVSLVNVLESTIARESNGVMPLLAGPEIGVASTKAYTSQILALYLFALQVALAKGRIDQSTARLLIAQCQTMPDLVAATLTAAEEPLEEAAELYTPAAATIFLGRGGEHVTALEGALKLKEIAYVHAAGYPAGEFKHGPIALVTDQLPVIALCPQDAMHGKMLANIAEVRARQGRLIGVGNATDGDLRDQVDHLLPVATAPIDLLQPLLSILPLQCYAYHIARARGCDVDQPRNLAKSVTVE